MNTVIRTLVLSVALLASVAPVADSDEIDYSALLDEAADAIKSYDENEWAFTESSIETDTHTVARFDPRRPAGQRWLLMSVDGRKPTVEEITEFAEDRADDEPPDGDDDHDIETMIDPDTLELVEETDEFWLFKFVPSEDDDDGFIEFMDGTVKIIKDGRYLQSIDIHTEEPFKPRFGVKVNDFLTRLTFGPAADGGPIVPMTIDIIVDVRAFLLVRVREGASITFSDYEYVDSRLKGTSINLS